MIIYFILLLFLLSNISNNKKKSFAILSFTLFLIGFLRTDSVGTDVKSYCNLFDGIAADFFHIDSLQLTDFMPKDSLYMLTASVAVKGEGLDFYSPKTRVNAELKVH